ncbi:hypothetical protein [Vibrio vulnificus YJ016]|uniref:Uncharacterized protein n=1 Tax=Vibrio vulnificus (strain YJ016) TaxID=196600 RepID=Q7MJ03_VIBVY|nr:hypothetical protein [Vibrio vulnificus YJ016]
MATLVFFGGPRDKSNFDYPTLQWKWHFYRKITLTLCNGG